MYRIAILGVVLLALTSCSKKESDRGAVGQPAASSSAQSSPPGEPAIPESSDLSEFERIAGARLSLYFDSAGRDTVRDVAPGDYFDVYLFAEHNELYPMSAAEYKLVLPENVSVMGTVQSDSTILSLGKYDQDFMIAYHCMTGPKAWLVKYACKAHEGFTGGTMEIVPGENLNFLGFTMCDATRTLIRARGGRAIIRKRS